MTRTETINRIGQFMYQEAPGGEDQIFITYDTVKNILGDEGMSPVEKIVFISLLEHFQQPNGPNNFELADRLGISPRMAQRAISSLLESNYIELEYLTYSMGRNFWF